MNYQKSAVAIQLLTKVYNIQGMHGKEQFAESLPLIEEALQSEDLKLVEKETGARMRFQYLKAVALDLTGKSEESLEILIGLVRDFPGTPDFESSLQVVCSGFDRKAGELLGKNPSDPVIRSLLSVLEQCSLPSYRLIHAVAVQEANEGKTDVAWGRMQALLALSPNDDDYLRCALHVADLCNMPAKRNELLTHIRALLESRPYRLELADLFQSVGGALVPVSSGT